MARDREQVVYPDTNKLTASERKEFIWGYNLIITMRDVIARSNSTIKCKCFTSLDKDKDLLFKAYTRTGDE